jgi:hypothetical protein
LDCEQNDIKLAATVVATVELREISLRLPMTPLNPVMPLMFGAFKVDEDANSV